MKHHMQIKRFVAIISILFPLLLLPACSSVFTSQEPVILTPVDTGGTPISVVGAGQGEEDKWEASRVLVRRVSRM